MKYIDVWKILSLTMQNDESAHHQNSDHCVHSDESTQCSHKTVDTAGSKVPGTLSVRTFQSRVGFHTQCAKEEEVQ